MTVETASIPPEPSRRRVLRHLLDNPVALKELRGRMRGARAFIVLTIYLLMLGAFTSLIYVAVAESSVTTSGQVNIGEIGRTLFGGIVAIEMLLVSFIAPAFTAGAISGEREHQTYDLLRTTLLPAYSLVMGKLLSSMLYVLLLLLAAIPLQSIAFFFGGVAETEVLLSFLILMITALLFSSIGLFFSARTRRTLSASVLTYATATFISFGIPLLFGTVMLIFGLSTASLSPTTELLLLYVLGFVIVINPAATALATQYVLLNRQTVGFFSYTLNNGQTITLVSPWIPFAILYLLLTVLFLILSVRRVHQIEA